MSWPLFLSRIGFFIFIQKLKNKSFSLSWLVITENFFNNISNYTKQNLKTLVTTCYLFCCLVIICFQLLPMYSIWILIISNNSCYVWVRSDGNQNRKLHIIMVMNFLIIQNMQDNNAIESNDKISNKPALSSLIFLLWGVFYQIGRIKWSLPDILDLSRESYLEFQVNRLKISKMAEDKSLCYCPKESDKIMEG
jgi:hypothetical protein